MFSSFSPFNEDQARGHFDNVYQGDALFQPHHASKKHELLAGAAGFAAMSAYESHLRATGEEPSHPMMKKILAGIAAAEVDKLIETKGLDAIDRRRAHKMAQQQAHTLADQRYSGGGGSEYARGLQGPAFSYDYQRRSPWGTNGCPSYGWQGGSGYGYGYGPQGGAFPPGPPMGAYGGYPAPGPGYGGGYGPEFAPPMVEGRHHHHHHHHRRGGW